MCRVDIRMSDKMKAVSGDHVPLREGIELMGTRRKEQLKFPSMCNQSGRVRLRYV